MSIGLYACSPRSKESPDQLAINWTTLAENLRAAGAAVEPGGEISQPFFAVRGKIIKVNGIDIQVFEYNDTSAAEKEAVTVSPNGEIIGTAIVDWIAPPHFHKRHNVIVLYVGDYPNVGKVLEAVLGPQFAGK